MKWKFLLNPLLFMPLLVFSCSSKTNHLKTIHISSVHDGDTFTDSNKVVYRLSGVDTPEVSNQYKGFEPTTGIERFYGNKATEFVNQLINGKNVRIKEEEVDRYGRHVAQVWIDDTSLSIELVKAGLARVTYISSNPHDRYYSNDFVFYERLMKAQYEAFNNERGLWADFSQYKSIFPKA